MFPEIANPFNLSNNVPILGLGAQLTALNPTPLKLQIVIETDKLFCSGQNRTKIGNGFDTYNNLPYTTWEQFFDYGSFLDPNNNTPIDAGTFLSPAVNFFLDFCIFKREFR